MRLPLLCDNGNLDAVIPLCRQFGYGIEVQAFYDPQLIEREPSSIEKCTALIRGITPISSHGCFADLCPGSFDPMVRSIARNRFDLSYKIAKQIGASHLVLHHGYVPHTSSPDNWLSRSIVFWNEFLADKDSSIQIHLENLLELDPDLLVGLIDAIDKPFVNLNLDIGHVHCNSKGSLPEWIRKLGNRIGYVHLHDNNGLNDEHLQLGRGNLPMHDVFNALKTFAPEAILAIEADPSDITESIKWLSDNGY
jgi:sugar phosphate isomerase/epimerase